MSRLPELAERIERLLLRHDEQKRTATLLEQQLRTVTDERDNLRSRLAAARSRIDALIDRLPPDEVAVLAGVDDTATPSAALAATPLASASVRAPEGGRLVDGSERA